MVLPRNEGGDMGTGARPKEGRFQREEGEFGMGQCGVGECRYRICFLNVQGLTTAKVVEIRNLVTESVGGDDVDGSTKVILDLVETDEKSNKLDWGDDIEHIEQMREQTDKKGGGLTMLKDINDYKYHKLNA